MEIMKQYLDTNAIESMFYQLSDDDDISEDEIKALMRKLCKAMKQDAKYQPVKSEQMNSNVVS